MMTQESGAWQESAQLARQLHPTESTVAEAYWQPYNGRSKCAVPRSKGRTMVMTTVTSVKNYVYFGLAPSGVRG
jgi:hypothetical protein